MSTHPVVPGSLNLEATRRAVSSSDAVCTDRLHWSGAPHVVHGSIPAGFLYVGLDQQRGHAAAETARARHGLIRHIRNVVGR